MSKKHFAIMMISIAYAMLLGHSVVPHIHNEHADHRSHASISDHSDDHHHHGNEHTHHEDNDEGKGILGDIFSHLTHADDSYISCNTTSTVNISFKCVLDFPDVYSIPTLIADFNVAVFHKPPDKAKPYQSPHLVAKSLRGPPSII
jgi:hypothetical protein